MARVAVTGMGIVSAIGNNVAECHAKLRSGESGLRHSEYLDSKYAKGFLFGEVSLDNEALFKELNLKRGEGLARTDLLAIKAFREAINSAGLSEKDLTSKRTAFLSASTVGGMSETEAIYGDTNCSASPTEFLNSYRSGAHTLSVVRVHGMKGPTDTANTACSSSANSIMMGARIINAGMADIAIVGGSDSLSRYTVNGFNALQIFSDGPTRPFDAERKGLNLGEGAAYLVLRSLDSQKGESPLATVAGFGNANDAYHPSAMHTEAYGVKGAMQGALSTANLAPSDVDMINAHGTGTINNDQTEMKGMCDIFGEIPRFLSTKGFTGHTLAAAGAIEAVFSILSIMHREVYPSLNHQKRMPDFTHTPNKVLAENVEINNVLSNSFGFGGNCSSLILSKS